MPWRNRLAEMGLIKPPPFLHEPLKNNESPSRTHGMSVVATGQVGIREVESYGVNQ